MAGARVAASKAEAQLVPRAEPKAAVVQPTRAVPEVKDEAMEISSSDDDEENDPSSLRMSKAELAATIARRKNRASATA